MRSCTVAVTYMNQSGVLSLPFSLHCRMVWMLAASYTLVISLNSRPVKKPSRILGCAFPALYHY